MNTTVATKKFELGRFGITTIFFTAFVALFGLLVTGLIFLKDSPAQASTADVSPLQMKQSTSQTRPTSVSETLNNTQPSLIVFYPVEVCQRRYCLTPEIAMAKLEAHSLEAVNVMSVPVYAVPMDAGQTRPEVPILDWDVYAVEPYADWLLEFSETVYGWGLEAPVVVLVDPAGVVLYRGDEYFDPEELKPYGEQFALED